VKDPPTQRFNGSY